MSDAKDGDLFSDPFSLVRAYEVKMAELQNKYDLQKTEFEHKLAAELAAHIRKIESHRDTINRLNGELNKRESAHAKRMRQADEEIVALKAELEGWQRKWDGRLESEGKPDMTAKKFDAQVAKLPLHAPKSREQAWIAAHPAMRRGTRGEETMKKLVLKPHDLEGAPSQWAVNQLQQWCNATTEFYKTALAADRKSMIEEGSAVTKDETPADWADIQRMFDSMTHARKEAANVHDSSV